MTHRKKTLSYSLAILIFSLLLIVFDISCSNPVTSPIFGEMLYSVKSITFYRDTIIYQSSALFVDNDQTISFQVIGTVDTTNKSQDSAFLSLSVEGAHGNPYMNIPVVKGDFNKILQVSFKSGDNYTINLSLFSAGSCYIKMSKLQLIKSI